MAGEKRMNGTTVSFNSVTYQALLSVSASQTGKAIDVSGADADDVENEIGRIDHSATLEVIGQTVPAVRTKGDLVITWKSGATYTMADALLTGVEIGGSIEGAVTMKLTFVKGVTSA